MIMIAFYGAGLVLWSLNLILDNAGGALNMVWWRYSQVSVVGTLVTMV